MMDNQQEKEVKKMKRKNYMKKIVTVLAVATMLMSSLSACGKTEDTTTDKPAAEASVETEQTSEAEAAGTETVAATEENTEGEDNRLEEGMAKVYTLIDAYNDLLSQHKYAEDLLQADVETIDDAELGDLGFVAADGNEFVKVGGYYSVLIKYYFDYVNNGIKYGDGYSDFSELAASFPDEKSVMESFGFPYDPTDEESTTNDMIMYEAVGVLPFLASCEAVHGTDLVETTEYVMGDYTSAYAIPLNCDGNTGLTAVFDADGNLMNICSSDDFDQYILSFPDGNYSNN